MDTDLPWMVFHGSFILKSKIECAVQRGYCINGISNIIICYVFTFDQDPQRGSFGITVVCCNLDILVYFLVKNRCFYDACVSKMSREHFQVFWIILASKDNILCKKHLSWGGSLWYQRYLIENNVSKFCIVIFDQFWAFFRSLVVYVAMKYHEQTQLICVVHICYRCWWWNKAQHRAFDVFWWVYCCTRWYLSLTNDSICIFYHSHLFLRFGGCWSTFCIVSLVRMIFFIKVSMDFWKCFNWNQNWVLEHLICVEFKSKSKNVLSSILEQMQ